MSEKEIAEARIAGLPIKFDAAKLQEFLDKKDWNGAVHHALCLEGDMAELKKNMKVLLDL